MSADDRLDPNERALAEQLARAPTAAPSAMLDARILAEARKAVAPRRRGPRWGWGLGASAAALLALGVFVPLWQAERAPPAVSELDWEPAKPVIAPEAERKADSATQSPAADAPEAATAEQSGELAGSGVEPALQLSESAPAAPTPATPVAAKQEMPAAPAPAPLADAPAPAANEIAEPAAAPQPQAFPASTPAQPPAAAPALRLQAEAPTSAVALPPPGEAAKSRERDVQGVRATDAIAPPPPEPGVERAQPVGASAGAVPERAEAESAAEAVATALEHIRSLLRDGRVDEARAALARLRQQHPQLVLPDDLRALEDPTP